jgi:hypothetical protein
MNRLASTITPPRCVPHVDHPAALLGETHGEVHVGVAQQGEGDAHVFLCE